MKPVLITCQYLTPTMMTRKSVIHYRGGGGGVLGYSFLKPKRSLMMSRFQTSVVQFLDISFIVTHESE